MWNCVRITYRMGLPLPRTVAQFRPLRDPSVSYSHISGNHKFSTVALQRTQSPSAYFQNQGQSASHAGLAFSLLDEVNYETYCPRLLLGSVLHIPERVTNPRLLPKQHATHLISSSPTAEIKGGAGCIGIFFTNQPRYHGGDLLNGHKTATRNLRKHVIDMLLCHLFE